MIGKGQLMTSSQARKIDCQHTKPCSDCPWSRRSVPGWLAGLKPSDWIAKVHSDLRMDCHTLKDNKGKHFQCAGAAIYRANVCKSPRDFNILRLKADTKHVFSWKEFEEHHKLGLFE
jgi:hypothetical protein